MIEQLGKAAMLFLYLCSVTGLAMAANKAEGPDEKIIMGWLETVFLEPGALKSTAKLDTGAKTSSIHAGLIEHYTKEGSPWVRFTFVPEPKGKATVFERALVRTAVIKERQSKSSMRDVVRLTICKNGISYETEFTLNDRSSFNYPILLGRSFLQDVALVDASSTFLHKADNDACARTSETTKP